MKLKKREPTGREKDQEAVELLERLREKLYCDNPSAARHSAFNLSWMQEDGFEILREAMFSNAPRMAKSAAAYGLRKMRGRMKKVAMGLLEEGLKHANEGTRQVCARALQLAKQPREPAEVQPASSERPPVRRPHKPKFRIAEIPRISHKKVAGRNRRNPPHVSRRNH